MKIKYLALSSFFFVILISMESDAQFWPEHRGDMRGIANYINSSGESLGDIKLNSTDRIILDNDLGGNNSIYSTGTGVFVTDTGTWYSIRISTSEKVGIGSHFTLSNMINADFSDLTGDLILAPDMSITTSSGGMSIDTANGGVRLPRIISSGPTEPVACASGTEGYVTYVDDTDDSAKGYLCLCVGITDDGAGTITSWDWLMIDGSGACPSF